MSKPTPTKRGEHAAPNASHHQVKVVSKFRLAEGHYSAIFPQDAGLTGPRNGHLGTHEVKAKLVK
jgi:hypothetical protein